MYCQTKKINGSKGRRTLLISKNARLQHTIIMDTAVSATTINIKNF